MQQGPHLKSELGNAGTLDLAAIHRDLTQVKLKFTRKFHGCDLEKMKVDDVMASSQIVERAPGLQD